MTIISYQIQQNFNQRCQQHTQNLSVALTSLQSEILQKIMKVGNFKTSYTSQQQ